MLRAAADSRSYTGACYGTTTHTIAADLSEHASACYTSLCAWRHRTPVHDVTRIAAISDGTLHFTLAAHTVLRTYTYQAP
jgi:hypothetical protein